MNIKNWAALLFVLFGLSACVSQNSWTPEVDTANDPNAAKLATDEAQCRELAKQGAHTGKEVGEGALEGATVGVLTGAALGAIGGDAGEGAAMGATGGAAGGGVAMARDSNADFKRIFTNCLRERGHTVLN